MRSIKKIQDVVDWGLCVGCGACYALCDMGAVSLVNIVNIGVRPQFKTDLCENCVECLSICPGFSVDATLSAPRTDEEYIDNFLIGPTISIWEGFATDKEIRFRASSGGLLTALALYCLEKEGMELVLHTGAHPGKPWENKTRISKSKDELLTNAGSRYVTSSPCDLFRVIEESSRPCVFIGKPCDTAAITALRKKRPKLDENLGLVLTFCCAGVPSVLASLDLMRKFNVNKEAVTHLSYRGDGWPGGFTITSKDGVKKILSNYTASWHFLQKYRSFRCHICPDGLGELCDISCGDAWHRYNEKTDNPGLSLAMVRTHRGQELLNRAVASGYLELTPSSPESVIEAQGLIERRKVVFGRQLAMKILTVPTTKFIGFRLFKTWSRTTPVVMVKSVLGTLRRLIQRSLWHRNKLIP
ncbi:MAG: Coenzyme F420 hydrogenase/dehydrogenase, beta subunit C-terminal domain [Desulfoprunum sp.]